MYNGHALHRGNHLREDSRRAVDEDGDVSTSVPPFVRSTGSEDAVELPGPSDLNNRTNEFRPNFRFGGYTSTASTSTSATDVREPSGSNSNNGRDYERDRDRERERDKEKKANNKRDFKPAISSLIASVMARPRTGSTVRLPLYDYEQHPHRSPRLRNGSPPKIRPRRHSTNTMFLYQLKYGSWWRPRTFRQFLRNIALVAFSVVLVLLWFYEPHVELAFYTRNWVSSEVLPVAPLSGCFDPARVSAHYNLTQARAPKRTQLHAGLPMRLGLDCYDFAGTIHQQSKGSSVIGGELEGGRVNFHTYWRADLVPFAERQEWMVKSFFATQDLSRSRLILWSNGDLRSNEMVRRWARKYPEAFQLKIVDVESLARGTALEGSDLLYAKDSKAWVDGDLVRLLVTWAYGGVWVDMDSLLTRDLAPLLEHEFVTQWDCYDKIYQPMNGAVMHFFKHSPYLCEAFEIMARSPPPKSGTTEWGSLLYFKLWRRLVAAGIPPFQVLPFCFTDGRSCRLDNRLPDPFSRDKSSWAGTRGMHEGSKLDSALGKIFSVHLHNQWHKSFPQGGWVERLLLKRYDRALGIETGLRNGLVQPREEKGFAVLKDHN